MAQHVDDVIGFIEKLGAGPVDLMGHSRGGHIGFRIAQARPDLLRRLVLAEPGGELEGGTAAGPTQRARISAAADKIAAGDIDEGLMSFYEGIEGPGTWAHLTAAAQQQLRDNAATLIGQVNENRQPYRSGEAEAIRTPTLFIGGADTKGSLATIHPALAARVPGAKTAMIPGAGHWMFERSPQRYCEAVLEFLS
jgi:pimeloyl-ACP methyl ester carboxylesterase